MFSAYSFATDKETPQAASININFSYEIFNEKLSMTVDSHSINKIISTTNKKIITSINLIDKDASDKKLFLERIKKLSKNKNNLLINYSGHGLRVPILTIANKVSTSFAIVLPNFSPKKLNQDSESFDYDLYMCSMIINDYTIYLSHLESNPEHKLSLENYKNIQSQEWEKCLNENFITSSEIENSVLSEHTLFISDSCHSGQLITDAKIRASRKKITYVVSTLPNELAAGNAQIHLQNEQSAQIKGGLLHARIIQELHDPQNDDLSLLTILEKATAGRLTTSKNGTSSQKPNILTHEKCRCIEPSITSFKANINKNSQIPESNVKIIEN